MRESLISKRIFPINGRIENGLISKMEKFFLEMCLDDYKKPAYLLVDSNGGDVSSAVSGYDFIKSLPFPVECTVVGDCHSSTLTIMGACEKRKATKHSRFLFHAMEHTPKIISTEDYAKQIELRVQQAKILFEQVLELQSSSYNISKEELISMREMGERYNIRLTAEEAKQKGIIHEIVEKFDFLKVA